MKIILKQEELTEAIKNHLTNSGLDIFNKTLNIEFTQTKGKHKDTNAEVDIMAAGANLNHSEGLNPTKATDTQPKEIKPPEGKVNLFP